MVRGPQEINYYRGARYPEYLKTRHWRQLNYIYIWNNPKAKCWICGERDKRRLLLHHVSYENLFAEVLNVDIYIVCFKYNKCHKRIHFTITGKKIPIDTQILLNRMKWLRSTAKIRNFRFSEALTNFIHWMIKEYRI